MRDFIASQNSERLRQRLTGHIKVREPQAFAKLAHSILEMGVITGIIARLYRMLVLGRATTATGTAIGLTFGAVFLLLMTALHVSRFPIRDWLWRAPAFAAIEGASEMLVSLILVAMGREVLGTGAAKLRDWPGMAVDTVIWRMVTISAFALLLSGVVKWVRYMILKKEHAAWSEGTVRAGIPGEALIDRRSSRTRDIDHLLFGRRKQDKKRG